MNDKSETWQHNIILPAFTESGRGLAFSLNVRCKRNPNPLFTASGKMANGFLPLFKRVYGILLSQYVAWHVFKPYAFHLQAHYDHYDVGDFQSAALGIAVGLYFLARKINHSRLPAEGIAGTGILRLDGSITSVNGVSEKSHALLNNAGISRLITSDQVGHIVLLEDIIWNG